MKWVWVLFAVMPTACSFSVDEFTAASSTDAALVDSGSESGAEDSAATDETSTADSTAAADALVTPDTLDEVDPSDAKCPPSTPNLCADVCTNLESDSKNCGKCGTVCKTSEKCKAKMCQKNGAG